MPVTVSTDARVHPVPNPKSQGSPPLNGARASPALKFGKEAPPEQPLPAKAGDGAGPKPARPIVVNRELFDIDDQKLFHGSGDLSMVQGPKAEALQERLKVDLNESEVPTFGAATQTRRESSATFRAALNESWLPAKSLILMHTLLPHVLSLAIVAAVAGILYGGGAGDLAPAASRSAVIAAAVIAGAEAILALVLALVLSRRISLPLRALCAKMDQFFDENNSRRGGLGSIPVYEAPPEGAVVQQYAEVGYMTASFTRMANRILTVTRRLEDSRQKAALEEYRSKQIMATANDGICLIDARSIILSGNQRLAEIFKTPISSLLGNKVDMLMPERYARNHDEYLRRYLETKKSMVVGTIREVVGKRSDGSEFPIELSMSEMKIGSDSFFVGMIRDITARKEMESQLAAQRLKTEQLLANMLPPSIARRLMDAPQECIADRCDGVAILFADIVEFTPLAGSMDAADLVRLLNDIFSEFDSLAEMYRVEKIKTLGDAFMCAAGVLDDGERRGAITGDAPLDRMARMALGMHEVVSRYKSFDGRPFRIRIGLHVGTVVAGVIGKKKYLYDLWGDAVNVASRMESSGVPGRTQVSKDAYERLRARFVFEDRGKVYVKGKGEMHTYILLGAQRPGSAAAAGNTSSVIHGPQPPLSFTDLDSAKGPTEPEFIRDPARLERPDFAVWQVSIRDYPALFKELCSRLGLIKRFKIRERELTAFVNAAVAAYRNVPFHNAAHAMDCCHLMYLMLKALPGDGEEAFPNPTAKEAGAERGRGIQVTAVDRFALMVAALCHDLDHPGISGAYLIASRAPLAVLYADQSPLERHHASRCITLLEQKSLSILAALTPEEKKRFLQSAVSCILATDMTHHGEYMAAFTARFGRPPSAAPAAFVAGAAASGAGAATMPDWALTNAMLLKVADLANTVRSFENSHHWAILLQQEQLEEGRLRQEIGAEVPAHLVATDEADMGCASGQVYFLNGFAIPMLEAIAQIIPHVMQGPLACLRSNAAAWEARRQEQAKEKKGLAAAAERA